MPRTRAELEQLERQNLAPYAQLSVETRGRKHTEEPPDWRTHYQRDRDRVIHSRAFRRLEYKTQVFLNGSGDHLRAEVALVAETKRPPGDLTAAGYAKALRDRQLTQFSVPMADRLIRNMD